MTDHIENINYLLLMLAFLTTIESSLVILDGYFVATKNSKVFDTYDLFIYKVPRFFIFYLLLDNGYSILPTGQSGLFRSQHYDDQTDMYNAGKFKPFKFIDGLGFCNGA